MAWASKYGPTLWSYEDPRTASIFLAGDDTINGGSGNDTLNGSGGADILTGGSGNDTFLGSQSDLKDDIITDFGVGDRIVLQNSYYGMWVANQAVVDTLKTGRLDISEYDSLILQGNFAGLIWNAKHDSQTNTTILMINSAPSVADDSADADDLGRAMGNVIQGALDGTGRDIDTEGDAITVTLSQAPARGFVVLNSDGSYTYSASALTLAAVKALGAGGTITDTFAYQASDPIGAADTGQVTITFHGVNDVAVIDGTVTGEATEDTITTVSGLLTVVDPDTGESEFQAQGDIRGAYGIFSFNSSTGRWTYSLDPASTALQALTSGAVAYEAFKIKAFDGTEQLIRLTVMGTDDATVIGGTTAGEVTEDATTAISGTLIVSDPDTGEGQFQAQADVNGTYGIFSFDASTGKWTYHLDNSRASLQALKATDVAQEIFTVRALDGTVQNVTVTVYGADDVAVTRNDSGGVDIAITDPSQLTGALGTGGVDQVFYGGSGTVMLPDSIENLTLTGGDAQAQGNALGNAMRGSGGDNALWGGGGNDWFHGGGGNDTIDGGSGRDYVFGGTGNDLIRGGAGNDTLYGYNDDDRVSGGSGNDVISGSAGNDTVNGGSGHDLVNGGSGHDRVYGDAGRDTVYGGRGNDTINGGAGNDILFGNAGRDVFLFDTRLNKGGNVDIIKDFNVVRDSLWLDNSVFAGLGIGTITKPVALKSGSFVAGLQAQDAQDRIIYDRASGSLYYDPDGTGSAAQVKFATISNKAKLTHHDFFVV
nr:VCBS domain-containing protein [Microvirga mediterraneensis]